MRSLCHNYVVKREIVHEMSIIILHIITLFSIFKQYGQHRLQINGKTITSRDEILYYNDFRSDDSKHSN